MEKKKEIKLTWDIEPFLNSDLTNKEMYSSNIDTEKELVEKLHHELINNLFYKVKILEQTNSLNYENLTSDEILKLKTDREKFVSETLNNILKLRNEFYYKKEKNKKVLPIFIYKNGKLDFNEILCDEIDFLLQSRSYNFSVNLSSETLNKIEDDILNNIVEELEERLNINISSDDFFESNLSEYDKKIGFKKIVNNDKTIFIPLPSDSSDYLIFYSQIISEKMEKEWFKKIDNILNNTQQKITDYINDINNLRNELEELTKDENMDIHHILEEFDSTSSIYSEEKCSSCEWDSSIFKIDDDYDSSDCDGLKFYDVENGVICEKCYYQDLIVSIKEKKILDKELKSVFCNSKEIKTTYNDTSMKFKSKYLVEKMYHNELISCYFTIEHNSSNVDNLFIEFNVNGDILERYEEYQDFYYENVEELVNHINGQIEWFLDEKISELKENNENKTKHFLNSLNK